MAREHASGIFILRKDKKLLICHPTNHAVDFFSIPKGKVEVGETMIDAAIRETFEETNIQLKYSDDFIIYTLNSVGYRSGKKTLHPFLFVEKPNSTFDWVNTEIKCNSNVPDERGGFPEMDGYQWINLNEAKKLLHETQVKAILEIEDIL